MMMLIIMMMVVLNLGRQAEYKVRIDFYKKEKKYLLWERSKGKVSSCVGVFSKIFEIAED